MHQKHPPQPVPRHYAQLVSVTCLFIAAKMEEVRVKIRHALDLFNKGPPYTLYVRTQERYPSLSLCTRVSDNAFRPDDVLRMEQLVLNTLGFQLHLPTALSYMGTLTTILDIDADVAHRAAFIAVRRWCMHKTSVSYSQPRKETCSPMHLGGTHVAV